MRRDDIIKEYEEILEVVTDFFGDKNKAEKWMSFRNHLLGGVSPAQLIVSGRADKLRKFVFNAIEENRREDTAA